MRVEIKNGCLEGTSSEMGPLKKKAGLFPRDHAVMRGWSAARVQR
jgi:hypothetical protein